jgi:hypothetical protein
MGLHAAVAQRCRGQLIGGDEGGSLVVGSETWMTEQGIRSSGRMSAALAPGFGET